MRIALFALRLLLPAVVVLARLAPPALGQAITAYTGARIFTGSGDALIENGVLLVRDGRIEAVGTAREVRIPAGALTVSLAGRTIIPGLINAHGHVGGTAGLRTGPGVYSRENVLQQLALYARYGITTVVSLGDDEAEGFRIRDAQDRPDLNYARLYVAGMVVTATNPDDARKQVQQVAASKANFVKIRVDDNLGATRKMVPAVYEAVIAEAQRQRLPVAVHLYYLEDARDLVRLGAAFLAHSVRDQPVDADFIALLKQKDVAYCPTLTREVSAYVYEKKPAFFSDPFFTANADPAVLHELENPTRQRALQANPRAQQYKQALEMAKRNLKTLADAGVAITLGTDSGPPGRFQGYFEHMEVDLMAEAGLTPWQILRSATSVPAKSLQLKGVGTLAQGNWADFVVLTKNPLDDIKNVHDIESVWIAGNRVPAK